MADEASASLSDDAVRGFSEEPRTIPYAGLTMPQLTFLETALAGTDKIHALDMVRGAKEFARKFGRPPRKEGAPVWMGSKSSSLGAIADKLGASHADVAAALGLPREFPRNVLLHVNALGHLADRCSYCKRTFDDGEEVSWHESSDGFESGVEYVELMTTDLVFGSETPVCAACFPLL